MKYVGLTYFEGYLVALTDEGYLYRINLNDNSYTLLMKLETRPHYE